MKHTFLFLMVGIFFGHESMAQVTVTVTNPTNTTPNLSASYTSLALAVTAVNGTTSMSGPVTLTCATGTETAPVGGYSLGVLPTSATNTITFTTSGTVTLTASASLTAGALNDAIFKLIGSDYITISGFTMQENGLNSTNIAASNNMTEWGIALLHASTTDGAQNNTIQNNTISLNRSYTNTFGIYSNVRHSATSIASTQDITNGTTAPNSGNKFYGNAISNVDMGITVIGSGTSANEDVGNDIGGSSPATGNTITNWGGSAASSGYISNSATSYCIFSNNQTADNISYNTITSANVSPGATFCGIRKDYSASQPIGTFTNAITYNTITMTNGSSAGTYDAILNQGMTALSTATVNINNNTIQNCAMNGILSSSNFIAIANTSVPGVLTMNNNIIKGNTSKATTGGFTGILNSGAVITSIDISNNTLGSGGSSPISFSTSTTAVITGILNSNAASGATITINNNTVDGISTLSSGQITGISNTGGNGANLTVSGNTLINTSVTGVSAGSTIVGISSANALATLSITGNIVRSNSSTATTGSFIGIVNGGSVTGSVSITGNQVGNATGGAVIFSAATTGFIVGVQNTSAGASCTVDINSNSVDGISLVTSGQVTGIYQSGNTGATINLSNNQLGSVTGTFVSWSGAQPNALFAIFNGGGTAATVLTITGNDLRGISQPVTGTNQYQLIASNTAVLSHTVSGNTFTNLSLNTTNGVYFMVRNAALVSGASWTCSNNSIVTGFNKTTAGSNVEFIYTPVASVNNSTITESNNIFSNVTVTGGTTVYGINDVDGASSISGPSKTITGNTISNITGGTGAVYGISIDNGASLTCSTNTISGITSSNAITGISIGSNNGQGAFTVSSNTISTLQSTSGIFGITGGSSAVPTLNVSGNTITGLSSSGASSSVYGVAISAGQAINIYSNVIDTLSGSGTTSPSITGISSQASGATVNIYKNKIYTLSETGNFTSASPLVYGITLPIGTTVTVYNNFIADLKATAASDADAIRGISVTSNSASTTYNLYFNSIYINASSTGTNFGTSGIYHLTNATATTAALTLIDNIIKNTSTANGTGITSAYRRSDATLTNFATASDYNLYYAGTPSPTNLIYYDGTNSDQTLAAYQALVGTRETNSISVSPNFTSSTDLHLAASNNCSIDGTGTPLGAVTDDIDGQTRDAAAPDMGADEFTATYGTTLAGLAGSAVCTNKTVSPAGTTYATSNCSLIATVLPSGGGTAVSGKINTCVTLDATQQYFNADPYVQRHFDIEPATNAATATATVTLYFTDAEFVLYNTNNPIRPKMPTVANGGNADPNIANVKITQFHGTPIGGLPTVTPGNYTGGRVLIIPSSVTYNGSYWSVTFNATGFSGFYAHSNNWAAPLPISLNYFRGTRQGTNHLLDWKVTCNSTPSVTMTLERSENATGPFAGINTQSADAVRCNQPFNYTDAQPLKGMNYYRLKMVDVNGKISYSGIVALLNAVKGFEIINVAPNPVTSSGLFKLNVTSAQPTKADLLITDMMGRVVMRQSNGLIDGYNSIDMNVSTLASGTYTISAITADEKTRTVRFVKQ